MKKNHRLMLLLVAAGIWLCVIAGRLFELQVRKHEDYRARAEEQQQDFVVLSPPRGTIYDARGRQLAVSVDASSAAAHPAKIKDPAAAAIALSRVTDASAEELTEELASGKKFVWIERKLDPNRADAVRELDLEGVFFLRESKRYYPLSRLAAQILGYVGTDHSGLAGLEFLYDAVVTSEPGRRTVVRDARRGTVLNPSLDEAATPGQDLHLSLDAAIQHLVERELAAAVASSSARRGMIVVMDPDTGGILAMASHPSFDPNDFVSYPRDHWRNHVVEDAFEPGSTFKMLTLTAALEAGMVDPLETIDCEMGGITLKGVRIDDHAPFGHLTTPQIIAKSSNVGAIKLGFAAGRERLFHTIREFGFGRPTGIDLPSESSGIVRHLEHWSDLSPAYISFGQGISVTALQLANAFATIANGGRLMKPYIVESIGEAARREAQIAGWPIAPSTVHQVRGMLEGVVLEGTAKAAMIEGYRAAGKTGTAQKVVGRGYAVGKYIASFVGFAPVKHPALVAAVILDEPWPKYHGGEVAAPVFSRLAGQILLYLGVPADSRYTPRPTLPDTRTATLFAGGDSTAGGDSAEHAAGQPSTPLPGSGHGVVPAATVPADAMPDFAGLSARQAIALSADLGLRLALRGHGAVKRQSLPPGTPLENAGTVEVWLATPEVM